jgi:hypothetical protein
LLSSASIVIAGRPADQIQPRNDSIWGEDERRLVLEQEGVADHPAGRSAADSRRLVRSLAFRYG